VLDAARSITTCVAEVFQRNGIITQRRDAPYLASFSANEPAILLYERCQALLATRPTFNLALADPALDLTLAAAARELGYILG
jgi:hypothetical protein